MSLLRLARAPGGDRRTNLRTGGPVTRYATVRAVLLSLTAAFALMSCGAPDYEPITFTVDGSRIEATGYIDRWAVEEFRTFARENPGVRVLVLRDVPGSVDDLANLELSRFVRAAGFTTIVPSDGLVASGGTDLFFAGQTRVLEPGACVGVHSWRTDDVQGADLPRYHRDHVSYLRHYRAMAIPEDFYWYTLRAAPADGIHWMTTEEATRYGLTTGAAPELGGEGPCDTRL